MTTWADVSAKINVAGAGDSVPAGFSTFGADDVSATWAYLFDLYTESDAAKALLDSLVVNGEMGAVAKLVGNEGGVVSGVFNLESSSVEAPDRRPRHDKHYHEA